VQVWAAEQPPDDSRLARLAVRQHGVVSRRQLSALGFSPQAIKTLVSRERVHRIHRGVYAVGHRRLTAKGQWMAAVLACGRCAVLSHHDGAALHDLRRAPSGKVNVTAPSRHNLPGIRCHWARTLSGEDCTVIDAIPVTTLARTYLDLAELVSQSRLIDLLEAGERQNKLDARAIEAVIVRNRGRHGAGALQAAMAELTDAPPLLQSGLERAFRHIIRTYGRRSRSSTSTSRASSWTWCGLSTVSSSRSTAADGTSASGHLARTGDVTAS
jgi:hypothetical protein